jgi:hypothetical protein
MTANMAGINHTGNKRLKSNMFGLISVGVFSAVLSKYSAFGN